MSTAAPPPALVPTRTGEGASRLWRTAVIIGIYLLVVYIVPRPDSVEPNGWRLAGLFLAAVAGLILEPIPGGAIVLISLSLAPLLAAMPIAQALAGYSEPTVWLVMAAFFISRALLKTGLARRIALLFVRSFGGTSIGVAYSLSFSDLVLAGIIPSNAARSGGVTLPIVRSISELYESFPGATAGRLGSFLMVSVYQSICVTAAMFFTGQASNPLAAKIATDQFGYPVTWLKWFLAGIVPGLCSVLVLPWVVNWLNPPEIRKTPGAAQFARSELEKMGSLSLQEWLVTATFVTVCGLWVTAGWHGLELSVSALLGAGALLATGVITWEDVKNEKAAWDIFIWYGGLLRLGQALGEAGVTDAFAQGVGGLFAGAAWPVLLGGALLIYFYAHYFFASITAHILAMYVPFLAVLAAAGAPIGLLVFAFACFTNFSAGLTNYGTTPSPMFFAHGYVGMGMWWKVGFVCSLVNLTIWSIVGFSWWKLLGFW